MKTSSPMMMKCVLALGAAMACSPHVRGDFPLTGPFTPSPGTAQAAFLMANGPAIMRLAGQARTGETDVRRTALEALASAYTDAALNLATELVGDPETAVATDSAKLLADTLAMAGSVTMGTGRYASGTPARVQFDAAIASLRGAVADERSEVRAVAAETLAALGDRTALDKIERGVEQGVVPPVEAIGYFGLAPIELGAPYIEKYLDSGPVDAKVAAVGYLATVPTYQLRVRDLIFGTPQVDEIVVAKAAGVLSRHDRAFPTYALEVIGRPGVPDPVSDAVIDAYISAALKVKGIDPIDWKHRVQAVDNALMEHPGQPPFQMIKARLMNGGRLTSE